MNKQAKANLLMFVVTMFWGLSYTFMVMGAETMSTFNIVAQRCLLAFFVAGAIFYSRMKKANRKMLTYSFIQGMFLLQLFAFSIIGLETTTAANAGFILSLTVVIVPIISSFLEKQLPSRAVSFALICTMIGIIVLTAQGSFTFRPGDVYMALGAVGYSIYLVLNGRFTKKVETIAYGVYQLGFAGAVAFILCLIFETPQLPQTTSSWVAILGLGLICSAFCFIAQAVVQQHTSPTHTGLIFSAEPLFAALFAMLFLGEGLTTQLLIGGSFILFGNLIAQMEQFHVLRYFTKKIPTKLSH